MQLDFKMLHRAGYTPVDYHGESEWNARELIESSLAIKCPNIAYHLAGTKKVIICICLFYCIT